MNQRDRHEDAQTFGELEFEMLFLLLPLFEQLHSAEPTHAVHEMDDEIPLVEIEKRLDRARFMLRLSCLAEHLRPTEELVIGENDQVLIDEPEAFRDAAQAEGDS